MKVAFYAPDGAGDKLLVAAVMGGAARHGDEVVFIPVHDYAGVVEDADVAACYGVRASTRIILDVYRRAGKRTLFFDKGYWGRGVYTRVAVDAWQPTKYLRGDRSHNRLVASGIELKAEQLHHGGPIIYAATTQTWHDFYDLGPARALDEIIVRSLASTWHKVIYRPRPAYAKKHPELCKQIDQFEISNLSLADDLARAYMIVTIGSNIAVDAIIAGTMVCVLGDHPCSRFSGLRVTDPERLKLLADLSYCQWTLDEYHSGEAWADIKSVMRCLSS